MNNKGIKDLVERLLENSKDEVIHKTLPEKRLVINDINLASNGLKLFDFYTLPGIFCDSIEEVAENYSQKLKVMAVSSEYTMSIDGLPRVDVGSGFLSTFNPRFLRRYKSMAELSRRLTKKLIEYNRLTKDDILAVSAKGEYILLTKKNLYMVVRHLSPTFFGMLILLSLGEQIIRTASSISYQRNPKYDFPYFMTIVGAVYAEKYKKTPKAKEEFDLQYADLADLMITLGIKGQEFSTNSFQKIQIRHLSMDSMAEIAEARKKKNIENAQIARDEELNELAATAELMMDETKYNPHISKEQQVYNKTGFAINDTVVKSTFDRQKFLDHINQYRDRIVKDFGAKN